MGNLVTLTYPDSKQVHYEYDAANRLVKVTDWAGRATVYSYDANGRLIETLRPNGTRQTRAYDAKGQLLQQTDSDAAGNTIAQFGFTYDASGDITEETGVDEGMPSRLPADMTYGPGNRLATYNGESIQFDADGNMTHGPLNGAMVSFSYDSRRRLTQAGTTQYVYDAENNRIGVNGTRFVVNTQPALSQVLVKEENGEKTFYVYGLGLIGEESAAGYKAYHFDFRGSTVALSDASGAVLERFSYSAYGVLLSGDASLTPFLFNGMYGVMTDGNGLYYMRARFYSAEIRRFLNRDVLLGSVAEGQTLNRFAFVTGMPVSFVDPFGLAQLYIESIGETILEYNPSASRVAEIIQSLPDNSIIYIRFTGHGTSHSFYLSRFSDDFINGSNIINDQRTPVLIGYNDDNYAYKAGRLDELLREKLHYQAHVEFAGCNTAQGEENLTKWLSNLLPEVLVTGGAFYQLSFVEGSPLNEYDGPNGTLGIKKTYITIGEETYEWFSFSWFE